MWRVPAPSNPRRAGRIRTRVSPERRSRSPVTTQIRAAQGAISDGRRLGVGHRDHGGDAKKGYFMNEGRGGAAYGARPLWLVLAVAGASTALGTGGSGGGGGTGCYKAGPTLVCCAAPPAIVCSATVDGKPVTWTCRGTTTGSHSVTTALGVQAGGLQDYTQSLAGTCTIKPMSCGPTPNSCQAGTPIELECHNTVPSGLSC